MPANRSEWWLYSLGGLFLLFAAALIAVSLSRPSPPEFAPDARVPDAEAVEVDSLLTRRVTLDARHRDRWVHYSFSRGGIVPDPGSGAWDLAVRRYHVVVNGGERYAGAGGAADLGEVPFEDVRRAPSAGYVETERSGDGEPHNAALEGWYDYSFLSHLLQPRPRTYVVRTADGRYAKLRFVSYYCPEAEPGCLTLLYSFQGGGGRSFASEDR